MCIVSYSQLWTVFNNDPKTWPPLQTPIYVLVDDGEDPVVVKVKAEGTFPYEVVFWLIEPNDDQDSILLQQYDVVAWKKA